VGQLRVTFLRRGGRLYQDEGLGGKEWDFPRVKIRMEPCAVSEGGGWLFPGASTLAKGKRSRTKTTLTTARTSIDAGVIENNRLKISGEGPK